MPMRSPYFRQLLKSYILVIAAPIFVMCVLLYQVGGLQLRQEILRGQQSLMTLSSAQLTRRLAEANEMIQIILKDVSIMRLSRCENEKEGLSRLAAYAAYTPVFDDLAVISGKEEKLYASSGAPTLSVLMTEVWDLSPKEIASFKTYISDGREHLYYFRDGGTLMRVVPFPQGGCLIVVLHPSLLDTIYPIESHPNDDGVLALCDGQGRPLYAVDKNGLLLTAGLREAAYSALPNNRFIHQGKAYWVNSLEIPETPWKLLTILPESLLRARMHLVYLVGLVAGAALFALGLAFFLARRQYKPIHRLFALAGSDADYATNELESISSRLAATQALSQTALAQRRLLMESLTMRLLQGHGAGWEEALLAMRALNMLQGAQWLTVFRIRLFAGSRPLSHDALLDYIHDRYTRQDLAYAVEMALNGEAAIAMVLKLSAPHADEELQSVAADLSLFARHQMQTGCFFGVGGVYPLAQIATSCLEASTALEYTMEADQQRIIRFEALSGIKLEIDPQFQRAMMLYIHSLKNADEASVQNLLSALLSQLDNYSGKNLWRFYAFRLAEALVQLVNDPHSARFRYGSESRSITRLLTIALSSANPAEYDRLIRQITKLTLAASQAWDAKQAASAHAQIQTWLEAHLTDPLLSLEMVTEVFGFSSTYWSRYFSEQWGEPFNDFVWRRRCEAFKELLIRTDRPIKALVLDVGYIDVSSFSRRFKQTEGMTPGNYRQLRP